MKTAPDPKDIQEFQFKQSNTSQILDAFTSIPTACNLLAVDKKRGLLYAGQNNKIIILKPGEDSDPEWKIEFNISVIVSKLVLNCDCSYLAVAPQGPSILIYDAQALTKSNIQLLHEIRISTSNTNVFVNDLRWNPTVPGMLCTVANDHTVGSFKIKEKKEKAIELKALEKFSDLDALCAAWSPKGKQIVVGCKNGSIVQFKPDLKVARTIPGPSPYIGEVVSILWISNYQFCAAYLGSEQGINVLIIDAPKGETNAIFTCYEDITYGVTDAEGEGAIPRYYFDHVPEWGLIIAASSNSSEIAVLGTTDKGVTWNQWQLVDSGRAELPLICTSESYPVGLAIDKSPVRKLPWGADSTLPHPVPILHILATSGQLCSFHMVNLTPNCPPINSPPAEIIATPPQARTNVGFETSLIMNGIATSTPRPKQAENVSEHSKPIPTGNIFDKFVQGSHFFIQPSAEKLKQEQKPERVSMGMKLEPTKEFHPQEIIKPDTKLTSIKETIAQEQVEEKQSVDDGARDIRAYVEEHNLFEQELRNRLEPQTWEHGTEEERRKLVDTPIIIDQFLRELKETTNSLSSDIAYLKALLLQSYAWVEEAKSKNAASNDITARNCEDSNKISDLQKLYYYTQTQYLQASKILDVEWSIQRSQEMSRMKIPPTQIIIQNVILHCKILMVETLEVERLKKKWDLISRCNNVYGVNRSLFNAMTTKSSTTLPRNAGIIEARCKAIASKTLRFTQEKQSKLKEHLSTSTLRIIKPVNPSPIQHRLEATLSSLASLNTTSVNTKHKTEQPVSKQTLITKQQQIIEKPKQQSPLASLNSIVARIGTNESNNISAQHKTQSKQTSFGITFPSTVGGKPLQTEKISNASAATTVPQSIKPKQDTITFNQDNVSAHTSPNLIKSFPKVDTIQKSKETAEQSSSVKSAWLYTIKTDMNLFNTNLLKDALPLETSSEKVQTTTANTGLKFGTVMSTTTAAKTEAMSTFSFASPITSPTSIKSTQQNTFVTSQTTSAQAFSFASKPSNVTTPLSLKMSPPPVTTAASQTQDSLSLFQTSNRTPPVSTKSPVHPRQDANGKYIYEATFTQAPNVTASFPIYYRPDVNEKCIYEPTFGTAGFQMLGQNTSSGNQISTNLVTRTSPKETTTTASSTTSTPSVTIEKVSSTESKTPSIPTSPVQALPASSATPLFSSQINTPNISIFGGMSNSTSTTSTFTVTTTTPAVQTTTTSSMSLFGGFITIPEPSSTASTMIATSGIMSPFQSSLSKPTFGDTAVSLPAASSPNAVTTTSSTLTFGNIATTSDTSVFGKPLTMNSQFPSTTPVSSAANTFGESATIPIFKPFGNSTNTSMFGKMPTTSASTSIFSGSNSNSIFGGNAQASSATSIFGGNASTANTFGTPQKSIFDNNTQKSDSIFGSTSNTGSASFFGAATNNATPGLSSPGSTSVFGGATANTAPMGVEQPVLGAQPAFGQTPSFNAKPVFGSPPMFGAPKPIFGGGFGRTAFAASATPPAFGSPPTMGGSPAPIDNSMPKVFGNVSGSSTFESLASQSGGLSFSSLAQKSADAPKSPVFTTGSSFSTWR